MTPPIKFGGQLRAWRESLGWSRDRAAAWYGCSPQAWSLWETGRHRIPRPLYMRLQELRYQEKVLGACRDALLAMRAGHQVDVDRLVALLESGTPDPVELKSAVVLQRAQARETPPSTPP